MLKKYCRSKKKSRQRCIKCTPTEPRFIQIFQLQIVMFCYCSNDLRFNTKKSNYSIYFRLNMTCLFRILLARFRHMKLVKQEHRDRLYGYLDKIVMTSIFLNTCTIVRIAENEKRIIPKAEKYQLFGETSIVEKVKNQIFEDDKIVEFEDMWKGKNRDIKIIDNEKPYKVSDATVMNKTGVLLCLSSKTYENSILKDATYSLPEKSCTNFKFKYVFVEQEHGDSSLMDKIREDVKTNSSYKIFKDSELRILTPISSSIYDNKKIEESRRQTLLYLYALCISLLGLIRVPAYLVVKKR